MTGGFTLTGPVQARAFDFIRIKHAIGLEMKGLQFSQGSALSAARQKGYVPAELAKRRKLAHKYMGYVTKMLTGGGVATAFGHEIIMGTLKYAGMEDCGCPSYAGSAESIFWDDTTTGVMCIHAKE